MASTDSSRRPHWLQALLIGRNPKFTLLRIVVLVTAVFVIRAYVIAPIRVQGPSMYPTYQENGINFVNRLAYRRSTPQRGDVVAIRFSGESVMYMKRIVGLPGETVQFQGGRLFINGEPLEEPYMDPDRPCDWDTPAYTLDPGWYYVVGDNRTMPEHLHHKGRVPFQRIVGKVMLCKNWFAF
jgi:signal peptidase I